MRSYREYCPIARASEIVAERWTPLVIRNLLNDCHTFTEIARGVPAMSRSLLIKRLKELERSGVVVKAGDGTYQLTDAGAELAGVINALETWGERWLDVTARSEPFTRWHLGTLDWRRALAQGAITVNGPADLARAIPTWNRHPDPQPLAPPR